jgi:hypothetical protein
MQKEIAGEKKIFKSIIKLKGYTFFLKIQNNTFEYCDSITMHPRFLVRS